MQLEKLKGEPSLSSAPIAPREGSVDWSAELENAQLENRIFSVTLDTLREEVNRLRAQNEKLRKDAKENKRAQTEAQTEASRLKVEVFSLRQQLQGSFNKAQEKGDAAPPVSSLPCSSPEKPRSTLPPLKNTPGAPPMPNVSDQLFSLHLSQACPNASHKHRHRHAAAAECR